jgi:cytochrome c553
MILRIWPLILVPALASAQSVAPMIARGETVFNQTCSNGYCHAAQGADGGAAPRLVARGFDEAYIANVVRAGVPGTAMAAFGDKLPAADFAAVIAYVDRLNGVTPSANPGGQGGLQPAIALQRAKLPPEAEKGRSLFFEATLGFGRCSTCHQVENLGLPIASPITTIPPSVAALKALQTPHLSTAIAGGDRIPALVLSRAARETVFYDLTSAPPVYRIMDSAEVNITAGSSWSHASAIHAYSDPELESILVFLRTAVHP